jgi:hypothetical protein
MSDHATKSSKRVLDPVDRVSEVLFGLIMVLTFTGSLSVANAGRDDIRAMLIGALGCNLAWGVIDGILYVMGCLAEKGRNLMTLQAVRRATDPRQAHRLIADALPPVIASVLQPAELDAMQQRLKQLPEPSHPAHLSKDDWLGGAAVFLVVFLSTFPVVIPFIVMRNAVPALRVSNAIAIVMLFITGYVYGRNVGHHPWLVGISMVLLGTVLGPHHGARRMRQARLLALLAIGALLAGGVSQQATPDPAAASAAADEGLPSPRPFTPTSCPKSATTVNQHLRGRPRLAAPGARYNYEDLKTGSVWIGYNWSVGKEVTFELTPMLGGVFGDTKGIAPACKLELGWRDLELSSESEYVFDAGNSSEKFFYTWSELGWAPLDWFRIGFVVQRTKVYKTDFDIQRGFLVGFAYKKASFTTYVFNPDASKPTVVLGVGMTF